MPKTVGRGKFSSHPRSITKHFTPTELQTRLMQFIDLHGPLSTLYLHEYVREGKRYTHYDYIKKECRKLWQGGMIYHPRQQRATEDSNNNYYIRDLTPRGIQYLKDNGLYVEAVRQKGHWVHQYMVSCITASMHIMCDRAGYTFIPAHKILQNSGACLSADVSYKWHTKSLTKKLTPDSLFAIDYGGSYLTYIVEADRNTEGNVTSSNNRKSALRNIRQYAEFVGKGAYRKHYGLNCPAIVLTATVSQPHIRNLIKIIDQEIGSCKYMAFGLAPTFRTPFKPPLLLDQLFDCPLQRNFDKPFIIKK